MSTSPSTLTDARQPSAGTNSRNVRNGWILVVIGPCLSLGITAVGYSLFETIRLGDRPDAHSHWTGNPDFTRHTFELLAAIFVFGWVVLAAGVFQIRTGRKNPVLVAAVLLVFAVIGYLAYNLQ